MLVEIIYTTALVIATAFVGFKMASADVNEPIEHLSINEREGFRY